MNHMTLPMDVSNALIGAAGSLELRDPKGKLVGFFAPADTRLSPEEVAKYSKNIDWEQVDRVIGDKSQKGRTLSEIWERLGVQEPSE